MEVKEFLCMKRGEGETSFAQSFRFTTRVIYKTMPVLAKAIQDFFPNFSSDTLTVADLGCAFGPNTMTVISTVISTVEKICLESNCQLPEFQVLLNDLPSNDFNSIFQGLPTFYKEMRKGKVRKGLSCFISAVPGSFHERLFPRNSLHIIYSSYSVHWLSQVPEGLCNEEGLPLNKGKIYMSKTSPPCILKAYMQQFQKDFYSFLEARSQEVVPNGVMVLILAGRPTADPVSRESCAPWEYLAKALSSMVSEGLINEEKLDSFNVPYYTPSLEEVREVLEKEGSFAIDQLQTFELVANEGEEDKWLKGEKAAKGVRAFTEPLMAHQFGQEIMDRLYEKLTHIIVEDLAKEGRKVTSVLLVLSKKISGPPKMSGTHP